MKTTSQNKPIVVEQPAVGEKIDAYLVRQLNANLNSPSTAVIDECFEIAPGTKVTRVELPGIMVGPGVELTLSVWWDNYEFKFKKESGKWSKIF